MTTTHELRPLGALFKATDPKELKYRYAMEVTPDFSKPANLQGFAPGIFDQGATGSCVGQAVARALYVAAKADESVADPPLLSRAAIYAWARIADGDFPTDAGTYAASALDAVLKYGGAPKESLFPWNGRVDETPSEAVDADAPNQPYLASHAPLYQTDAGGLRQGVVAALQAGRPCVIGVNWYGQFDNPPASGILPFPITSQLRGGHEITILRYEPATNRTPAIYWCDNSWSTQWGVAGRFAITDALLASKVVMDARVVLPTAVQPKPQPPSNAHDIALAVVDGDVAQLVAYRDTFPEGSAQWNNIDYGIRAERDWTRAQLDAALSGAKLFARTMPRPGGA